MNDTYITRGRGTLANLINELERQQDTKVDFVADARQFGVHFNGDGLMIGGVDERVREWMPDESGFTRNGLNQFLAKCDPGVPRTFYDKLPQDNITSDFLTHLFRNSGKRRLFRMLDGKVRAVQSDQYKIVDHIDLAFSALQTVQAVGGEVIDCRLTDSEMRISFTTREVAGRVIAGQKEGPAGWQADATFRKMTGLRWGDYEPPFGSETVHPCISLRNSETGQGGLHVEMGILESACLNMALVQKQIAKVHLGQRMEVGMYEADTREAMGRALIMQVRDVLQRSFNPEWFNKLCAKLNETASTEIEHPTSAVMNFAAVHKMPDAQRDKVLQHFLSEAQYNVFQLARAVSRSAQEFDAGAATEMEQLAGETMVSALIAKKCDRAEAITR